jgi:hypothetical protein
MNSQTQPPDWVWDSRGELAVVRERLSDQAPEPSETDKLKIKVEKLEVWKKQALLVENEWDPQALAKMLGGQLGQSCRKIIQKEVPRLIGHVADLERQLAEAREQNAAMREAIRGAHVALENALPSWRDSVTEASGKACCELTNKDVLRMNAALAKLRPSLTDEPS